MTFDDQLKRAFDTLSERLRAEVDRQVAEVMDDLAASARAARDRAAEEAREQAHAAGMAGGRAEGRQEGVREGFEEGRRQGLEEGRQQGIEEGRQQGIEEGRQQGLLEGRQQGVLHGRQQAEEESREAIAAAVAATQAERMPAEGTGDFERLVGAVGAIGRARSLSEILDELLTAAAREAAQADVWVVRGGELRKWRADGDAGSVRQETATIGDAVRSGTAVIAGREVAVPIALAGQVVAVLAASGSESRSANVAALDVLTRYAERCLETLTAFKTARAVSERIGATGPSARDAAMAEEEASARRYARLLVSEIKLYHEPAVVEGRRDRDLATRLGGEIARARVLYEERVPLQVRQRADFFHDELVRTLANGDATLLQIT